MTFTKEKALCGAARAWVENQAAAALSPRFCEFDEMATRERRINLFREKRTAAELSHPSVLCAGKSLGIEGIPFHAVSKVAYLMIMLETATVRTSNGGEWIATLFSLETEPES
ncbi:MAG: hypothetical protein V3U24_03665 [Candidatus Neomarinimicrobiota bacterium]